MRRLMRDESGKGAVRFTLASCVVAMAAAAGSPAFQANPLIRDTIGAYGHHLPEALTKAAEAMQGH